MVDLSEVVKSRTSLRVLQVGVVERRLAADASVRGKVVPDSLAKTTQDLQPKCGLNARRNKAKFSLNISQRILTWQASSPLSYCTQEKLFGGQKS